MQTRRIVWSVLAVSIWLGFLGGADAGPTAPVQAVDDASMMACVTVDPYSGGAWVNPEDCVDPPTLQ